VLSPRTLRCILLVTEWNPVFEQLCSACRPGTQYQKVCKQLHHSIDTRVGHANSYVNPLTIEARIPYEAGPFHKFTHYFPFTLPFVITVKKITNRIQHEFILSPGYYEYSSSVIPSKSHQILDLSEWKTKDIAHKIVHLLRRLSHTPKA